MQVELKNLIDGRKTNVRFRSSETVERVRLDTKAFQYLYAEGDQLTFMDKATYDQVQLPRDLLGDAAAFLQYGTIGRASCRDCVCHFFYISLVSVSLILYFFIFFFF